MTGPVVMKMKMEMMLILTLYVPRPTLHCRLSGSGGQWESLSVKSGLIISINLPQIHIIELCLLLLLFARDSVSPMATGHTPRKKPPPVAPKPRVSLSHHSTHTAELDYQLLEDPSSFLEVSLY